MFKKILLASVLLGALNLFAHEGHDNVPGAIKASHGGTVKAGKEINLEYITSGDELKMYPLSHEGKDLAQSEVKLNVTGKLPKGKFETIKTEYKEGAYIAKINFKGAYRMEIKVDADTQGKKSSFSFQVEK